MSIEDEITKKAREAKKASLRLANLSTDVKNRALIKMTNALEKNSKRIIAENKKDAELAIKNSVSSAFIDRLTLDEDRIKKMASCLKEVARLKDPINEIVDSWKRPNGLIIQKIRVPLGVIGIIYESRPDVTSDAIGICLKSGNSIILKGGSEAIRSNKILVEILSKSAYSVGIPKGAIQFIESTNRNAVKIMLRLRDYLDVIIPRGGGSLIKFVAENSSVPVIETGEGNCHMYVDKDANLDIAYKVVFNAKCQRPGVCNAIETLLVHKNIASSFLPKMGKMLTEAGVELRGCQRARKILKGVKIATENDWKTEYLALILAVRVVDSLDDAIAHINKYGTMHSDAIITENKKSAIKFTHEVDSAAVYVNASTRFTDGNQFGLGAEIGISTQKLHTRGPMSVRELTSMKYIINGRGQIRT